MYIKISSVTITIIIDQFIENDTNFDKRSKTRRVMNLSTTSSRAQNNCK